MWVIFRKVSRTLQVNPSWRLGGHGQRSYDHHLPLQSTLIFKAKIFEMHFEATNGF